MYSARGARLLTLGALLVVLRHVSRAQDTTAAPPPLGKLVDIGGRGLHLNCTGRGSLTVVVENGSSGFSMEWALVQQRVGATMAALPAKKKRATVAARF